MKKPLVIAAVAALVSVGSVVAVRAAGGHPSSERDSIEDGCNRSQLALLGEAAATMDGGPHPTGFASWVYVKGDRRPKTLEGTVLGTHTAGTDLFGVHDTYDVNFDVVPDGPYEGLLSTRNAAEDPKPVGQIHTEWESGLAPLFAWPSPGDRVRETGSEIWDCGHWQDGEKTTVAGHDVPGQDYVPGDPLGSAGDVAGKKTLEKAGVHEAAGEEIEIHPIMELATWRSHGAFVPGGATAPVAASQLDVALSNQGGKAKGVEECALLAPKHPAKAPKRLAANPTCSTIQDITGRRYTYRLDAPGPQPTPTSHLVVQPDQRYQHGLGAVQPSVAVDGDHATIDIDLRPAAPSTELQDVGVTFHAYWSDDHTPLHRFRVTQRQVTVFNNLDGDKGDNSANPSVDAPGEWNMFTDVDGHWTNLHDLISGPDYAPELGAVPSATGQKGGVAISLLGDQAKRIPAVPVTEVDLPSDASLHLFSDARECDQPGYKDCPTEHNGVGELATTGASAGRSDIRIPVTQLVGRRTVVTVHPIVCGGTDPAGHALPGCTGEQDNPVGTCGMTGCYSVTFVIEDVSGASSAQLISGDGTAQGTTVNHAPAASLSWWQAPLTRYAPDEGEEYVHVRTVIDGLGATGR